MLQYLHQARQRSKRHIYICHPHTHITQGNSTTKTTQTRRIYNSLLKNLTLSKYREYRHNDTPLNSRLYTQPPPVDITPLRCCVSCHHCYRHRWFSTRSHLCRYQRREIRIHHRPPIRRIAAIIVLHLAALCRLDVIRLDRLSMQTSICCCDRRDS